MKKYNEIYGFRVADTIQEGGTALCVDLKNRTIVDAATLSIKKFFEAKEDKSGRFVFFEEYEEEEQNEEGDNK